MARKRKGSRLTLPPNPSALLGMLNPKRQEIIRVAFQHPREYVLLSVRAIAHRLHTDPATMVRIVRGMNFGSYREFQHYLHELSILRATSMDTMQTVKSSGRTLDRPVRGSLEQDRKNLDALARAASNQQIVDLARHVYKARRIFITGGDLAATLVNFLQHHLMILDLPVSSATTPAEVVHKVRFLGKKDLVIAISFGRGLRQTVEGLRQARENGAYCVGITDTLISPISQFAHECFLSSVETPSIGASYVAPMALLNVIVVACANYRRARTLNILKNVEEEQQHGFRWYEP